MSITEEVSFDKDGQIERFPLFRRLFLALIIILVSTLSFGIGRLSVVGERAGVRIEYDPEISITNSQKGPAPLEAKLSNGVVASKNGNKYHYPDCPGAKQIAAKNLVSFATTAAAEASGYTLALNCKH